MTTPAIRTRQQDFLTRALKDVDDVEKKNKPKMAKIYGGLCHKIPVLIRTCGLCQALAFIESKKGTDSKSQEKKDREEAYTLLHTHIASILDITPGELLKTVGNASVTDYIRLTRLLLSGWVYYKRFAVSILNVEDASQAEDEKS